MTIALIDNYDSFTYNLVHYLESFNINVTVFRNNEYELKELLPFDALVLSPGPGLPKDAGLLLKTINTYYKTKPIFGVCLGLQAIAENFGSTLKNLETVYHGVSSEITVLKNDDVLYLNLPNKIYVGRYHSWVVQKNTLPSFISITAIDSNEEVMSFSHNFYPICAVQYHPESVLTPLGKTIIKNWINSIKLPSKN